MRLEGKVALITGGGTGIGLAIAERFAAEGAKVCITGRRQGVLDEALGRFSPGTAVACCGDVSRDVDAERMVAAALTFGGKLDVLVNNAGINPRGSVTDLDSATWRSVLDVNLTGPFLMMKAAIPHMIKLGQGSVINISSLGGVRSMPAMASYCTSKAGLIMLTQQAAVDYGPNNVRVNCICPGGVRTPMMNGAIHRYAGMLGRDDDSVSALVSSDVPMRRLAEPAEITGTCVYLASDDSSYTNGAVIMADGGAYTVDVGRVAIARALRDAGVS
jgi:meso-butanediol dehydrogenase / (S,S)-butanediol dehydrogenase / diacetyl reductase